MMNTYFTVKQHQEIVYETKSEQQIICINQVNLEYLQSEKSVSVSNVLLSISFFMLPHTAISNQSPNPLEPKQGQWKMFNGRAVRPRIL